LKIGAEGGDDAPANGAQAGRERRREPAVGREPDQAYARIRQLLKPHELDARIGRAVVDHDHLGRILDGLEELLELFPQDGQALGLVADGQDDRKLDGRRVHAPPPPSTSISSLATRWATMTRHEGCADCRRTVHDFLDMITAPLAGPARSSPMRARSSSTTGRRR